MRRRLILLLCAHAGLLLPLEAQNCANTQTGREPLSDLGVGTYAGFSGGLYGAGANQVPAAHAALGDTAAAAIRPLDAAGMPSAAGRVVVVSVGMSNSSQEFSAWKRVSDADPLRNPAVTVVDLAQNGQSAAQIANPNAVYWSNAVQELGRNGLTPEQVQVVWLKQAMARPTQPFPQHAQQLQSLLETIVGIIVQKFPNVHVCFLSSRIYAGYAVTTLSPEPWAYESGFSVKWTIDRQIAGAAALHYDPDPALRRAPWLAWGPYTWADGLRPRSDGLVWQCADFQPDGTHPSPKGAQKVVAMLDDHFTMSPFSAPWYYGGGARAAVLPYGAVGCSGGVGPIAVQSVSTPFVGNPSFQFGIQNAVASSPGVLWFADAPASIALEGCIIAVDPMRLLSTWPFTTNANGNAVRRVSVPPAPGLVGASLFTQWLVLDPAAPGLRGLLGGAAMTRGVELRIGTP